MLRSSFGVAVHAVERRMKAARQEQVRQLLDQIVQIEIVQRIPDVLAVSCISLF
jgi:hypothetical protein